MEVAIVGTMRLTTMETEISQCLLSRRIVLVWGRSVEAAKSCDDLPRTLGSDRDAHANQHLIEIILVWVVSESHPIPPMNVALHIPPTTSFPFHDCHRSVPIQRLSGKASRWGVITGVGWSIWWKWGN